MFESESREPLGGLDIKYEGHFLCSRKVDLMKTAKVNAYIMHIFGKIELLSTHAT